MDYEIDLKNDVESYAPQTGTQPQQHEYQYQQPTEPQQPVYQQNIQPEKKLPPTGCTKFFNLEFYEQYFQVTQTQVVDRIVSAHPIKRDFIEKIRSNPDFYGPFWILTTIIFLLGSAGNLSNYFNNWSASGFVFNLSLIRIGVVVVYPFGFGVPTLLYFVMKFTGGQRLSLPELICIYGYSFSMFVVILVLCVLPFSVLQWLLMVAGMLATIAFLILNMVEYLDDLAQAKRFIFFGIIGAAQITLFLVFKLVFFGLVYPDEAPINPTI